MLKAIFSTPFLALVFAAGGVGLAWLWFSGAGWAAIAVVLALIIVGFIFDGRAAASLPDHPVKSVQLIEGRVIALAGLTAGAAALTIIFGATLVAPDAPTDATAEVKEATKELKAVLTAVSAALAAFVTALAVKAEDIDTSVGTRMEGLFAKAYPITTASATSSEALQEGTIPLPRDSEAAQAVHSAYAFGDWNRANRAARAKVVQEYIDERPAASNISTT